MKSRNVVEEKKPEIAGTYPGSIKRALSALSLAMLMASLDTSIVNASLPTFAQSFDAPFGYVQWIILSYLITITALMIAAGRLGDILGRKKILLIGIGIFTGASVLCGVAPNLWFLIIARMLQGVGGAAMMALTVGVAADIVSRERAGTVMGLLGTMSAVGTTMGPALGGLLTAVADWRAIFLINVPFGIIAIALAKRFLPADPTSDLPADVPVKFEKSGPLLLGLALGMFSLSMTTEAGLTLAALMLLLSFVGIWFFIALQRTSASPLLDLSILRDKSLSGSLVMSALVATVMMSTLVVGPFYLSRVLGLPIYLAGFVLSCGPLIAAISGVPSGRFVDRLGSRRMTFAGLTAIALGLASAVAMPIGAGIAGYIVPIGLATSGYALFQSANNTAVMAKVSKENRGVIAGMLSLSRNLGLITGASVMGAVFALSVGSDPNLAAANTLSAGFRSTLALAAAIVLCAISVGVFTQISVRLPAFARLSRR